MDEAIKARLDAFIQRKQLRRTGQRDRIVEEVFSRDDHFTAEELYERVRRAHSGVSRATIYRTLALLVEAGLLREIDLGESETTYDPNFLDKPSHNHLVCIDCGKVLEFEDANIDTLNDCVTRRLGYRPVEHTLTIKASCEQLRLKGRCPNLIASRLSGKRLRKRR
ncbi:MAG TPA: transcriptional repressor [Luteolibacter sp.]|nr:transcriptional repressor [Luteolibacter sp.]